jgi:hypothetical protein
VLAHVPTQTTYRARGPASARVLKITVPAMQQTLRSPEKGAKRSGARLFPSDSRIYP